MVGVVVLAQALERAVRAAVALASRVRVEAHRETMTMAHGQIAPTMDVSSLLFVDMA